MAAVDLSAGADLSNAAEAAAALGASRATLVWRRLVADTETPVGAAVKLIEPGRGDFLLESVEGGAVRGRYSLLGLDPDLVFRVDADGAAINREWQHDRDVFAALPRDGLRELRALVAECRIDVPPALPSALACLVGYFGYETIGLVEKLPRAAPSTVNLPDMLFVRPTLILVFDRLGEELFAIAPLWPSDKTPALAIADAGDRLCDALRRLAQPAPPRGNAILPIEPELFPTMPGEKYRAMVLAAKEYIAAGDIFQVVLAQRFTCPFALPPLALYRSDAAFGTSSASAFSWRTAFPAAGLARRRG